MNELIFYRRDRRGRPTTTFIAEVNGSECRVGIARCNPRDVLSKREGRKHARARFETNRNWRLVNVGNDVVSVRTVPDKNKEPYLVALECSLPLNVTRSSDIQAYVLSLVDELS